MIRRRPASAKGGTGFRAARDGSVAVEFAMVGTLLVGLLFGAFQVGLYLYVSASLEQAVAKATREVMTGSAGSSSMTAAQFRTNVLCPLLPSTMPCANVITNINTVAQGTSPNGFYQFVNNNASWIVPPAMDNTKTSFCTGSGGTVVYAQVYYAMPILFSPLFGGYASQWQGKSVYFVGSFAAFRNEPFQNTANGAC